jgi:hypothetical protein
MALVPVNFAVKSKKILHSYSFRPVQNSGVCEPACLKLWLGSWLAYTPLNNMCALKKTSARLYMFTKSLEYTRR